MRRIAVVATTAVVLGAGVGMTAVPASAAPARKVTKSWVTFNGKKGSVWRTIKVNGKYTRTGQNIVINGWLHDNASNGWSPAVQFRVWQNGQWKHSEYFGVKYVTSGKPVDRIDYNYGRFWKTTGTHLQVREAAVKVSNDKNVKFGSWKKLF